MSATKTNVRPPDDSGETLRVLLLAAWMSLASCGMGTAGIVAGASGGGGGSNAPVSISGFSVVSPKVPEDCEIRFVLSDAESNIASVSLYYRVANGPEQPMTALVGQVGNTLELPTSKGGMEHRFGWRFCDELDLPADADYEPGVLVFARVRGGIQDPRPGTNAMELGMGNSAPVVESATPPDAEEVGGVVPIELRVSDSSSDVISIRVEYDDLDDEPDAGWRPARPSPRDTTPAVAIEDVVASADGTELVFFWDTDADLHHLEREAMLRFTPADEVATGVPYETPVFRVDNNAEPIAIVHDGLVTIDPDQRRGIPVPYEVIDAEGDAVQVVFQWRRPGEGFPVLPRDPLEIAAILADSAARRDLHVCSKYPGLVQGRVSPIDLQNVELPELGGSAAQNLARGLEGAGLEILRSSSRLEPVAASWAQNPLREPRSVLSLGDGLTALVLDEPSSGAWRLSEVVLATGEVATSVTRSPGFTIAVGDPDAMTFDAGARSALVASDVGGMWQVHRVDLETWSVRALVGAGDGTSELGSIRGIASLGVNAALITVGSSLVRLDWTDPLAPTVLTIVDDLATPWGLALDPFLPSRVWVAEHDGAEPEGVGRVTSIDLATGERRALVARSPTGPTEPGLPRPRALALRHTGARLLVVCDVDPVAGQSELRGVDLGGARANTTFVVADVPRSAAAVATGPDGLLLLAVAGAGDLLVGGGLQQRRTIVRYEPAGRQVSVSEPFYPPLRLLQPWRIGDTKTRTSPEGTPGTFVWDSADVQGGEVLLRATAFDSEAGLAGETLAAKHIAWEQGLTEIGGPDVLAGQVALAVADLDGNGDLDVAAANGAPWPYYPRNTLTVFLQTGRGAFDPTPLELGGTGVTDNPKAVVAADLDGDGHPDLVSANQDGDTLTVFLQTVPGSFDQEPSLVLGSSTVTDAPRDVAAGDLDGDGDLDLVSANELGDTVTVFFQSDAGGFEATPSLELGGPSLTDAPSSVATADIDGDGDLDVVNANLSGHTITVFLQTTSGAFDPTPSIELDGWPQNRSPVDVEVADLDGDGDLDLVSANAAGDTLTAFFQTSRGIFHPEPLVLGDSGVTAGPYSVHAADLDGDGDLDLVSANGSVGGGGNTLALFFQTTPGRFDARPIELGGYGVLWNPQAVEGGDLDGDGDLDLVCANASGARPAVFLQASPGAFDTPPLSLGDISITQSPHCVAAADLDGDGDLDLVSANGNNLLTEHTLTIFFQTSPGIFDRTPLVLGNLHVTLGPRSVAAVDLDGDGDLDLVSANSLGDTLAVFLQEEGFDPMPALELGGRDVTRGPYCVVAADLDGDDAPDLVSANRFGNTLTVFFQSSAGTFDPQPSLVLGDSTTTSSPFCVVAADLDGDGDLDLASANAWSNTLTIFFQTGPGAFDETPSVLEEPTPTAYPVSVCAADVDGDGDLDLVSANHQGDTLTVYFQTGPGQFDPSPLVLGDSTVTDGPTSVSAADLDADGDLDIVCTDSESDTLTVFRQSSPGVFDSVPLVLGGPETTVGPEFAALADVDGDGDLDIVSANFGHTLTVFWGGR